MKIKELTVTGLLGDPVKYSFGDKINLVHSDKNAKGKTTLIRLILHSLGLTIPATEGLKGFDYFGVKVRITNKTSEYTLNRHGRVINLESENINDEQKILPLQQNDVLKTIFEINDDLVLENILGIFYIDQEKGWTMFNRGKVIGSISFNIENYISGLSDKRLFERKEKIERLQKEIKKYNSLLTIARFQNEAIQNAQRFKDANEEISKVNKYRYMIEEDKRKIRALKEIIKDNDFLISYIEKVKLAIVDEKGNKIPVTRHNIDNFSENNDLLKVQIEQLNLILQEHKKKLLTLESKINERNRSLGVETVLERIEDEMVKIDIDISTVERALTKLMYELKETRSDYKKALEENNNYIDKIYGTLYKYAHELGVSNYLPKEKSGFIWTNKLRGFSGKILAQIAFCFRLAYIQACEEKFKIKLPIIIDSPRSSEMNAEAAREMLRILLRDFSDNQIIIASNYEDFIDIVPNDAIKKIELKNGALCTL